MIHIGGRTYELVYEHKNAWNPEVFRDRYSEVLERYDYIIGDWGYNQLRLKGFFKEGNPKANRETAFSGIIDYINEYCNFGCAYFVLQKAPSKTKMESSGREPDNETGRNGGKSRHKTDNKDNTDNRSGRKQSPAGESLKEETIKAGGS